MKLVLVLCLLVPCFASGAITNVVDIAALAACGTGTTNGWTLSGIDSYSDRTSIRINKKDEYLLSPDFTCAVTKVLLSIKSSSQDGKRLAFIPLVNGLPDVSRAARCSYSPNKDTYVPQTLVFGDSPRFSSFEIAYLDEDGNNTGWGISEMTVVTDGVPVLTPSRNLRASNIRATGVRIRWENSLPAVSNRVSCSETVSVPESYSVVTNYDFAQCVNPNANDTQDRSSEFHSFYSDFIAEKLYYPALSSGLIRISTGTANGSLTYCGLPDYTGTTMRVIARRYAADTSFQTLSAYYVDDAQKTNVIGTIALGDDFTTTNLSLDGLPGGSAITLANLDGAHSGRRFLVDNIAFLSDYRPAHVETNLVTTLTARGDSITIPGLRRQTDYLVTVTAFDAEGNASPSPKVLSFTTAEHDCGLTLMIR